MVAHFLVSGGLSAHDSSARKLEIHTLQVLGARDEEKLLLEADESLDAIDTL